MGSGFRAIYHGIRGSVDCRREIDMIAHPLVSAAEHIPACSFFPKKSRVRRIKISCRIEGLQKQTNVHHAKCHATACCYTSYIVI